MCGMPLPRSASSALLRTCALIAASGAVALFAGCGDDDSGSGSSGGGGNNITATTGAEIFKEAGCTSCHTLAAAGGKGTIGPNLDEEKPPAAEVVEKVTNGDGSMPSFKNRMTPEQIQAVSDYVASVAGQ